MALTLLLVVTRASAWGNHSLATYRALETMPEVAQAGSVTVETLDSFLRSEEKTIEVLLASQEAWAASHLGRYSRLPSGLIFTADTGRSDESRRLAFLMALRVAPNSKFALTLLPDSGSGSPQVPARPQTLDEGATVAALAVVASATDEPALGMDFQIWEDSPSEWARIYGLGPHPDGKTAPITANTAPNATRILVPLRVYQFSSLASLAFRTGHAYWGWRFAGIALHYVQDLTQPYYATSNLSESSLRVMAVQVLAKIGWDGPRKNAAALRNNQARVLDKYQAEMLQSAASCKRDDVLDKALRNAEKDRNYPDWSSKYLRDTIVPQAQAQSAVTVSVLLEGMPAQYVRESGFDFAAQEAGIQLCTEVKAVPTDKRARLDSNLSELLSNFGAHSRNALRAILRASPQF